VPVAADGAFLVVIFAAVYVRRFGPRWFAIGMIAFMAYFMGDYLKPHPSEIGWMALAAALALLATHIVATLLLPDDPERDFRRALTTIDGRINLILRALIEPGGERQDTLPAHLSELHDAVLMAEGFIPQGSDGPLATDSPTADLAIALFELQLAIEQLVRAGGRARLPRALLRALLRRDGKLLDRLAARASADAQAKAAAHLAQRAFRARADIDMALGEAPSPVFALSGAAVAPATAAAARPASASRVPLPLQRPIQVTLACALALGIGQLLSPVRWYWAVITAFIVFNNTRSRADTAVRALQRSAGTFAGLIVGTFVATLLQEDKIVSGAGVLLLFFLAFYFLQISYGLMIFLVTIALALVYGLMGMFTPELLLLRLEETLVGGIAGAAVAFLVFPTQASAGVAAALEAFLAALEALVAAAKAHARGEDGGGDPAALALAIDRSYADVAATVRPLGGPWGVVTRFGQVRENLLLLASCVHWSRVLARGIETRRATASPDRAAIDALVADVEAQIAELRRRKATVFERAGQRGSEPAARRPPPASDADADVALPLAMIATLLARLAA
jgi:hypothetical protein